MNIANSEKKPYRFTFVIEEFDIEGNTIIVGQHLESNYFYPQKVNAILDGITSLIKEYTREQEKDGSS